MGAVEPVLVEAARAGDVQVVLALLRDDPAGVGVRGSFGKTPLHVAAEHDHVAVVQALLTAGADVEATTKWGMTALEWAATLGNRRVGELLLASGARSSLYVETGLGRLDSVEALAAGMHDRDVLSKAFQIACRNGHTAVASLLLERGAAIDHPGYFDAPGLHWAAINGHLETVRFLLEQGADASIRDAEFDTDALGWARESGNEQIESLLASTTGRWKAGTE